MSCAPAKRQCKHAIVHTILYVYYVFVLIEEEKMVEKRNVITTSTEFSDKKKLQEVLRIPIEIF